jgi:hypothetical protein
VLFAFSNHARFLRPSNLGKPRKTGRELVVQHENPPTRLGEEPQLMDVSALYGLTTLIWLSLEGCNELTDVSGLSALNALTSLNLRQQFPV